MGLQKTSGAAGGVVYDLDGTLVDSRDDLADSVNAMLGRLGLPERDPVVIYGFIGEGAERLIRRSLGPTHEERYPKRPRSGARSTGSACWPGPACIPG